MLHIKAFWKTLTLATAAIALLLCFTVIAPATWATVAPSQQPKETVHIHLGNRDGGLVYEPSELRFIAGKAYKLVLDNPSPVKHYFTAKDFADTIWTIKVQAGPVEVKGAIHELELQPNSDAEWVFIPQKPGTYELHCAIAGHAEAGMVGQLQVVTGT